MMIEYAKHFLAVLGLRKEWAEKNNGAELFLLNDFGRFVESNSDNFEEHLAEFVRHFRIKTKAVALAFGGCWERCDIGYISKNVI